MKLKPTRVIREFTYRGLTACRIYDPETGQVLWEEQSKTGFNKCDKCGCSWWSIILGNRRNKQLEKAFHELPSCVLGEQHDMQRHSVVVGTLETSIMKCQRCGREEGEYEVKEFQPETD